MVRPCVARDFVDLVVSGLASMYPAFDWSSWAPGHHGYQRACDLISGQASTGPFGSPVFACAGKTEPPSRLILSQTSAGKACRVTSWRAPHLARFPCSIDGRRLEAPTPRQNAPGDASQLVGERNPQHVAVQHGRFIPLADITLERRTLSRSAEAFAPASRRNVQ